MKKNQINLILAFLSVIAIMSLLSAATTLNQPIANSNHSGTISLLSCQTNLVNANNATFLYNLTSSGTAINILVSNVSNTTSSGGSFNISSTSVSGLTDSMTYTLWCRVTNSTGQTENGTVNLGITIDNTSPKCLVIVEKPTFPYKGTYKVSWSVTDALSLVSNAEAIDGPQTQTNKTDSTAVSEMILSSIDTGYVGDWLATATGTDRAGNTCSASATFKSYMPDGQVSSVPVQDNSKIIFVVVGIGIALFFLFGKKK